jgi:hypothetical protein
MLKISHPQLADVQRAFEAWRQSGRTRTTPPALRAQAVQLLAEYSVREVIRALHVDHRRLSRWERELSAASALPDNAWVELPAVGVEPTAVPPAVSMTLTRQAVDGSAVSISAELSEAQWRWALRLLQASGS